MANLFLIGRSGVAALIWLEISAWKKIRLKPILNRSSQGISSSYKFILNETQLVVLETVRSKQQIILPQKVARYGLKTCSFGCVVYPNVEFLARNLQF